MGLPLLAKFGISAVLVSVPNSAGKIVKLINIIYLTSPLAIHFEFSTLDKSALRMRTLVEGKCFSS